MSRRDRRRPHRPHRIAGRHHRFQASRESSEGPDGAPVPRIAPRRASRPL